MISHCNSVEIYYERQDFWVTESTKWFKYDGDDLCVNKSQFVPVIFEPPCTIYCIDIKQNEFFSRQDRQYMYNVILKRVRVTIVAVEKQYHIS
jgi:hypothetical protein